MLSTAIPIVIAAIVIVIISSGIDRNPIMPRIKEEAKILEKDPNCVKNPVLELDIKKENINILELDNSNSIYGKSINSAIFEIGSFDKKRKTPSFLDGVGLNDKNRYNNSQWSQLSLNLTSLLHLTEY